MVPQTDCQPPFFHGRLSTPAQSPILVPIDAFRKDQIGNNRQRADMACAPIAYASALSLG
jgi:hypothetical protein